MMRTGSWLSVLVLLLVTACSTTFVYNRLETLIPWYIGRYVELERPQRQQLRELVGSYLHSHRTEELPQYLTLLDQAAELLDREITGDDLVALYSAAESAAGRLQEDVLDRLLVVGASLDDQQIQGFIANLREHQTEYREKYLDRDDEAYREDIRDSLTSNSRRLMGRLDREQKSLLSAASEQMIRTDSHWLQEREALIDALDKVLSQRQPGWQTQVRHIVAQRVAEDTLSTNPDHTHNVTLITTALAAVINSRSSRQDRRLRQEIDNLRGDLLRLISQPQRAAASTQSRSETATELHPQHSHHGAEPSAQLGNSPHR